MKKAATASILVLLAAVASAHSFHASITELELNPATKRAEVAVRVFSDDLEAAINLGHSKHLAIDSPGAEARILAYVNAHLSLRNAKGEASPWKWIGRETDVKTTWIYVDAPWQPGATAETLVNSLFFELFPDQVNSVNIMRDGKRSGVTFVRGDQAKKLP